MVSLKYKTAFTSLSSFVLQQVVGVCANHSLLQIEASLTRTERCFLSIKSIGSSWFDTMPFSSVRIMDSPLGSITHLAIGSCPYSIVKCGFHFA